MSEAALDRLTELLDERDDEIVALKREVGELKHRTAGDALWTEHRVETAPQTLPIPRLELLWERLDPPVRGYTWVIRYDLVKAHLCDRVERIPLGSTMTDCVGPPNQVPYAPFRDGAHASFDALHLKLPAYIVYRDIVVVVDPTAHHGAVDAIKKLEE